MTQLLWFLVGWFAHVAASAFARGFRTGLRKMHEADETAPPPDPDD